MYTLTPQTKNIVHDIRDGQNKLSSARSGPYEKMILYI